MPIVVATRGRIPWFGPIPRHGDAQYQPTLTVIAIVTCTREYNLTYLNELMGQTDRIKSMVGSIMMGPPSHVADAETLSTIRLDSGVEASASKLGSLGAGASAAGFIFCESICSIAALISGQRGLKIDCKATYRPSIIPSS